MRSARETFDGWLHETRAAIAGGRDPDAVSWSMGDDSLFSPHSALVSHPGSLVSHPSLTAHQTTLTGLFVRLARAVSCHRDPSRWDALYAVAWRLANGEPELLSVATDPAVYRLVRMYRAVKRASHKMKAFVRFRRVERDDGDAYVAWFEPAHLVVERTAPFFARRFPSMRWSILTPDCCAHWDGASLSFSDGVSRASAPSDDELEDLWRTYYGNIFNPARLNGRAMRAQMPVHYWRNLPEARSIAGLQRDASHRVDAMLAQVLEVPEPIPDDLLPTPADLAHLATLDTPGVWDPTHDPGASEARRRELATGDHDRFATIAGTRIDLGVAGWTDPSILAPGVFYPRECTTPEQRLRYYASRYSMVEVDATYYALPARSTCAAWVARTPDDFTFDVKAHALMTGHPTDRRRLPDWLRRALPARDASEPRLYSSSVPSELLDEVWRRFVDALDPLRAANKLGAVMLQFPRWFEPTRESANALRRARERFGATLATVELRNRAWMEGRVAARTLALLEELQFSYVIVDAPQGMRSSMPPTAAVTNSELAVVRLHGRRVATWEAKNDPVTERYRYLYDEAELRTWADTIRGIMGRVARVHMTFNNNHANYATTNAAEAAQIFRES